MAEQDPLQAPMETIARIIADEGQRYLPRFQVVQPKGWRRAGDAGLYIVNVAFDAERKRLRFSQEFLEDEATTDGVRQRVLGALELLGDEGVRAVNVFNRGTEIAE